MVVILHDNPNEIQNTGNQMKELQSIKDDTKLLASNNDQFYMEVSQATTINISKEENNNSQLFITIIYGLNSRYYFYRLSNRIIFYLY